MTTSGPPVGGEGIRGGMGGIAGPEKESRNVNLLAGVLVDGGESEGKYASLFIEDTLVKRVRNLAAHRSQISSTPERAHVSETTCAADRLQIVQTARPAHDQEILQ
jgi:hypothetical protein